MPLPIGMLLINARYWHHHNHQGIKACCYWDDKIPTNMSNDIKQYNEQCYVYLDKKYDLLLDMNIAT